MIGQSDSVYASYVCCFWGEQRHLDRFLQAYAVVRATQEARKKGLLVNEQALPDGSIRLQIHEGG